MIDSAGDKRLEGSGRSGEGGLFAIVFISVDNG